MEVASPRATSCRVDGPSQLVGSAVRKVLVHCCRRYDFTRPYNHLEHFRCFPLTIQLDHCTYVCLSDLPVIQHASTLGDEPSQTSRAAPSRSLGCLVLITFEVSAG